MAANEVAPHIPLTMLRTVPRKWRTAMSDQPLYRPQDDRPATRGATTLRRIANVRCLGSSPKADSASRGISIFTFISETNRQIIKTICHYEYHV